VVGPGLRGATADGGLTITDEMLMTGDEMDRGVRHVGVVVPGRVDRPEHRRLIAGQVADEPAQRQVHGGPRVLLAVVAVHVLDLALEVPLGEILQRIFRAVGVGEQHGRVDHSGVHHAEREQVVRQAVADQHRVGVHETRQVALHLAQTLVRLGAEIARGDAAEPRVVVDDRPLGLHQRVVHHAAGQVHQRHLGQFQAQRRVAHLAVDAVDPGIRVPALRPVPERMLVGDVAGEHEIVVRPVGGAVRVPVPHVALGLGAALRRLGAAVATAPGAPAEFAVMVQTPAGRPVLRLVPRREERQAADALHGPFFLLLLLLLVAVRHPAARLPVLFLDGRRRRGRRRRSELFRRGVQLLVALERRARELRLPGPAAFDGHRDALRRQLFNGQQVLLQIAPDVVVVDVRQLSAQAALVRVLVGDARQRVPLQLTQNVREPVLECERPAHRRGALVPRHVDRRVRDVRRLGRRPRRLRRSVRLLPLFVLIRPLIDPRLFAALLRLRRLATLLAVVFAVRRFHVFFVFPQSWRRRLLLSIVVLVPGPMLFDCRRPVFSGFFL